MAIFVVPPFDLSPPAKAGGPWKLVVDVGVEDADRFACDISTNEVRVSFADDEARQPVCCALPPEVPRMDPTIARCKFSSRKRQLVITWGEIEGSDAQSDLAKPPKLEHTADISRQNKETAKVPVPANTADISGMSLEEVDAKIDDLSRECSSTQRKVDSLADCNPQQRTSDHLDKQDRKLVQTLAAQIVRLNRELPDAGSEYLTEVVDTALGASGKASDEAARALLLLEIGHTLGSERGELQVHCYEKAAINLSAKCDEEPSRRLVVALGEALLHSGLARQRLKDEETAEAALQGVLDVLHPIHGDEVEELKAKAHRAMSDIMKSRQKSDAATGHLEAAASLFKGILTKREHKAEEVKVGFAEPDTDERIPIVAYSFVDYDPEPKLTVRVTLDEALFLGASKIVTNEVRHVRWRFETGAHYNTGVELHISAPKTAGATKTVLWVLRMPCLRFPVIPDQTAIRIRKGVVSLVFRKETAYPWHCLLRDQKSADGLWGGHNPQEC